VQPVALGNVKNNIMNTENLHIKEFDESAPLWHLCTPGDDTAGVIFRKREDFVFGMNMMALCTHLHYEEVELYTFQLMNNHVHILLQGDPQLATGFFNDFKARIGRYLRKQGRQSDMKGFEATLHPILNITYLRNLLAYINRNGFLVDLWETRSHTRGEPTVSTSTNTPAYSTEHGLRISLSAPKEKSFTLTNARSLKTTT
jgi:REP element-mobilizing transposase RayT